MSDFFAPSYWYGAGPNIAPLPINTNYGAQLSQQQAYVGAQNQAALAAAAPMPPGYGQVHLPYLSGSFGSAAAPGTYSSGSGRSSFSGTSLGSGGGSSVFDTGTTPFNTYGYPAQMWAAMTPEVRAQVSGGGIGSDAARAPNQPEVTPFQSYVGGYNPYSPSTYAPAAQGNIGGGQPKAAAPAPDFDFRWGDTQNVTGRPFQQEYEDWFNKTTAPARGKVGGWEESYLQENPDVLEAAKASGRGLNTFAQEHANSWGAGEGRQIFDAVKYLQQNPDVAASNQSAYQHYNNYGRAEGREASWGNIFDPATYLRTNTDVQQAGVDPRTHWLQYGQKEGRQGGGVVAGSRDDLAALMSGAQDKLRAGQGWTVAQQPPAASQGTLTSRINQGIYDIGNAGTLYGQQGLGIAGRGTLTPQDMSIPHAYPPEVRNPGPQSNLNWYGMPNSSS